MLDRRVCQSNLTGKMTVEAGGGEQQRFSILLQRVVVVDGGFGVWIALENLGTTLGPLISKVIGVYLGLEPASSLACMGSPTSGLPHPLLCPFSPMAWVCSGSWSATFNALVGGGPIAGGRLGPWVPWELELRPYVCQWQLASSVDRSLLFLAFWILPLPGC